MGATFVSMNAQDLLDRQFIGGQQKKGVHES